MKRTILFLLACQMLGCAVDSAEVACPPDGGTPVVHVADIKPAKPLTDSLVVTGTIDRPPGVTIYNVFVAGVAATASGLNFDAFTATVPYATLVNLAAANTDGSSASANASIPITALTNCFGAPVTLATLTVSVSLAVQVTSLTFAAPVYPNSAGYLPADQGASAVVTIQGNAASAGASVVLTPSAGSINGGAAGAPATVILSGDGKSNAAATFTFKSPEIATISAVGGGASAATSVKVVGAPVLSPSLATLSAGDTIGVTAQQTAGALKWCQASPAAGIHVVQGSGPGAVDLMATPAKPASGTSGTLSFNVSVDSSAPAKASTTVSCVDVFDQLVTGTFSAPAVSGGIPVTSLTFAAPVYPNSAGYLPADLSASAVVTIQGNPGAAGASVVLTPSVGSINGGAPGAAATLTLSGDGMSNAAATFAFKSPASATISAVAGASLAATFVKVVGAPVLSPSSATLGAGNTIGVTAQTAGALKWCQASPAAGIHVVQGSGPGAVDLMATPVQPTSGASGSLSFNVSVDSSAAAKASTTVSCVDIFGQLVIGTFSAGP